MPPGAVESFARHRSLIYARKGNKCYQQVICEASPDITALKVEGITFVSIYRASGADLLPLLALTPSRPTVIGSDFNAAHPELQPMATRLYGDGQVLID